MIKMYRPKATKEQMDPLFLSEYHGYITKEQAKAEWPDIEIEEIKVPLKDSQDVVFFPPEGFFQTDTNQFCQVISDLVYAFMEINKGKLLIMAETNSDCHDMDTWYEDIIYLEEYNESEISEHLSAYGHEYKGNYFFLHEMGEHPCREPQIIAECIFEQSQY